MPRPIKFFIVVTTCIGELQINIIGGALSDDAVSGV